jgi:hypothetical protein
MSQRDPVEQELPSMRVRLGENHPRNSDEAARIVLLNGRDFVGH